MSQHVKQYGKVLPNQLKAYKTYQINSNGRVFKNIQGTLIDITDNLKHLCGYILLDGKHLHRIMMKLFKYDPIKHNSRNWVVDHINKNKLDNSVDNLRYATYRENALNVKAPEFVPNLPEDWFAIQFVNGQYLKSPVYYSPSADKYFRRSKGKGYRIIDLLLTCNAHYFEFTDHQVKHRFKCINNIHYNRSITREYKTRSQNRKYTKKDGTVVEYIYQPKLKTQSELKKETLVNFIKSNQDSLNRIKTLQEKTNYINENIQNFTYSMSMVYNYL